MRKDLTQTIGLRYTHAFYDLECHSLDLICIVRSFDTLNGWTSLLSESLYLKFYLVILAWLPLVNPDIIPTTLPCGVKGYYTGFVLLPMMLKEWMFLFFITLIS
jgi:hypothetical protein